MIVCSDKTETLLTVEGQVCPHSIIIVIIKFELLKLQVTQLKNDQSMFMFVHYLGVLLMVKLLSIEMLGRPLPPLFLNNIFCVSSI